MNEYKTDIVISELSPGHLHLVPHTPTISDNLIAIGIVAIFAFGFGCAVSFGFLLPILDSKDSQYIKCEQSKPHIKLIN